MTSPDYSTTRLLVTDKPECFDKQMNDTVTLLKTPNSDNKIAEGGLRLQGYFKTSTEKKPLITVVTVVYNGAEFLEETIKSVIEQTYDNVEYIIVDGGSTDGTLDIIRKYEHAIDYWVSEPDGGMYDALSKGFTLTSGKFVCYLNAGDLFSDHALKIAVSVFLDTGVKWITGLRSICNQKGYVTGVDLPFRYLSSLIQKGFYGTYLPYIQQESTFWDRDLLSLVSYDALQKLKLAGDYYLWFCFSHSERLTVVKAQLGFFKIHSGQLSESIEAYWEEALSFTDKKSFFSYLEVLREAFVWALHPKVRSFLFKENIYYSNESGKWNC